MRGTAIDDGPIARVVVNGREARALLSNFAEWEVILDDPAQGTPIRAHAEDRAAHVGPKGHELILEPAGGIGPSDSDQNRSRFSTR